jgi:hypothetical protein
LDFSLGGVTGTFYGLDNSITTPQAATLDFVGLLDTWIGLGWSGPGSSSNSFVFDSSGNLVDFFFGGNFRGLAGQGGTGFLEAINFDKDGRENFITELSVPIDELTDASQLVKSSALTIEFTQRTIAPIPLPAGALLLLTGLAGLAVASGRRKRAV